MQNKTTNCNCFRCNKAIYRPRYSMVGESPVFCGTDCRNKTNRTKVRGGWENQQWTNYPLVAEILIIGQNGWVEELLIQAAKGIIEQGAVCAILIAVNIIQGFLIKYLFEKLLICVAGKKVVK